MGDPVRRREHCSEGGGASCCASWHMVDVEVNPVSQSLVSCACLSRTWQVEVPVMPRQQTGRQDGGLGGIDGLAKKQWFGVAAAEIDLSLWTHVESLTQAGRDAYAPKPRW